MVSCKRQKQRRRRPHACSTFRSHPRRHSTTRRRARRSLLLLAPPFHYLKWELRSQTKGPTSISAGKETKHKAQECRSCIPCCRVKGNRTSKESHNTKGAVAATSRLTQAAPAVQQVMPGSFTTSNLAAHSASILQTNFRGKKKCDRQRMRHGTTLMNHPTGGFLSSGIPKTSSLPTAGR